MTTILIVLLSWWVVTHPRTIGASARRAYDRLGGRT